MPEKRKNCLQASNSSFVCFQLFQPFPYGKSEILSNFERFLHHKNHVFSANFSFEKILLFLIFYRFFVDVLVIFCWLFIGFLGGWKD